MDQGHEHEERSGNRWADEQLKALKVFARVTLVAAAWAMLHSLAGSEWAQATFWLVLFHINLRYI